MTNTMKPTRFAPVLRYLVEVNGMYSHPSRTGFTAGQEVWSDPCLQFHIHRDAKQHALNVGGEVLKLRVRATLEKNKTGKTINIDTK